jgi:hypothetical protein
MTENEAEKAVYFLRDSAVPYAKARGYLAYCDAALRRVKSLQILEVSEGPMAEREAKAYASEAYLKAITELQGATYEFEKYRAQREAAGFAIELWRSQNSARKAGINL